MYTERETASARTMNHENVITSSYGSGFYNSHSIKCSCAGLFLLRIKILAG